MMEEGKKGFFFELNCTLMTARCLATKGVSEEQYPGAFPQLQGGCMHVPECVKQVVT